MSKILLIDLETAPDTSYTWHGKFEVNVIEFIEEGYILSFAYKWLGDKSVKAYSLADFKGNRKKLVKKLHELLDQAEVVITQNGDGFDLKWANRAFIFHGMKPPSPFKSIDTLKIARSKFNFNSNRLDDLGEYLKVGRKMKHEGFSLWRACMKGDKSAFKRMVDYNKQDIVLLESVYKKLMPWSNKSIADVGMICPSCDSTDLIYRGYNMNKVFISRRLQCKNCGRWTQSSIKLKIHSTEYVK